MPRRRDKFEFEIAERERAAVIHGVVYVRGRKASGAERIEKTQRRIGDKSLLARKSGDGRSRLLPERFYRALMVPVTVSKQDIFELAAGVGDGGGYAYLSPATGIAVNRNSAHTEWALEFLNYLFTPEVNRAFAEEQNIIPNTAQALDVITDTFHVDDAHVCQLGQVTFRYVFYDVVHQPLIDVSKANNPKYMQPDGTMYDLEYYMAELESAFAAQRT